MAMRVSERSSLMQLPVHKVRPSPHQPRTHLEEHNLRELAESIRELGVLEPILVAPAPEGNFEILAGERRWRAACMAGLETIPALILDLSPDERALVPLVENLLREDLPPLDTAKAFSRLLEALGLGPTALAKKLGLAPRTIYRYLDLLKLPEEVQEMINSGVINASQAFELASISEDEERCIQLARMAAAYGIAARQLGRIIQRNVKQSTRATFAQEVLAQRKDQAEAPAHVNPRQHLLEAATALRGHIQWQDLVRLFDVEICHGTCGQWRYPSVCEACPALALLQMLAHHLHQSTRRST